VPGGAIYEDDLVYASHAFRAGEATEWYLGHLGVETKRHVVGLTELNDAEAERVGAIAVRLARALRESQGAEWVYLAVLGHHEPHFHLHVVPRYPGTPREWWGLDVHDWPDAPRGGADEIAAVAERIRTHLG
jgi:histidine triad (HIT) family protein